MSDSGLLFSEEEMDSFKDVNGVNSRAQLEHDELTKQLGRSSLLRPHLTDEEKELYSNPLTKSHLVNFVTAYNSQHGYGVRNVSDSLLKAISEYAGVSENNLSHVDAFEMYWSLKRSKISSVGDAYVYYDVFGGTLTVPIDRFRRDNNFTSFAWAQYTLLVRYVESYSSKKNSF